MLSWASRAGCKMVFLGLEAEEVDALATVNKRLNLQRGVASYEVAFRRIHRAGIAVLGAFIFGMDGDTPEKLYRRAEYMVRNGVDVMQTTFMTPLTGTRLFEQLRHEDRLLYTNFPCSWDRYDMTEVTHQPQGTAGAQGNAHTAGNAKPDGGPVRLAVERQLSQRLHRRVVVSAARSSL